MRTSPFRRGIAILLCVQPTFWMSSAALAQTVQTIRDTGAVAATPSRADENAEGEERGLLAGPSTHVKGARVESAASRAPATGLPIDEPVDPDKYVCSPGDVFELNFWGLQNFRLEVAIDLEGRAFVPKVGYLELRGKTLSEVRGLLKAYAARIYPRLGFDLTLARPRTFLVQVAGAVANPGAYGVRAIDRVAAVLALSGGIAPKGSRRRVEVRRRSGEVLLADLVRYEQTGELGHNPLLQDGDVVRVPFEDLVVTVGGAVNRPGRYELIGSRDLAEAIELAGGLGPGRTTLLPVQLIRRMPDEKQRQVTMEWAVGGALPPEKLTRDDVVTIPSYLELQRSVIVIGAVLGTTNPEQPSSRRLPFVDGDTVRTVLERVGGVDPSADMMGAYLLRDGKSIPVDLFALLMQRELKADVPIALGDSIVVPFKRREILVDGAVFRPGMYPHNPSYGISQYLSLAGGPNRFAQAISNVRVVTAEGETLRYQNDLRIAPGSTLVVPERSFSRAEVVQIILGAAGILVSGAAVVIATKNSR